MPQKSDRVITENPMSEHGVGTRGDWGWGTVLERFEGGSCGEEQFDGLAGCYVGKCCLWATNSGTLPPQHLKGPHMPLMLRDHFEEFT